IDVQSLAGDSADNVPGIKGIGIKTAAELINMFGDLDTLLDRAEEIKQPKRRERLMEGGEAARLSRELVTLKLDTPVLESAGAFALNPPNADRIMAFLTEMEFRTLSKRVAADLGVEAPEIKKVTDKQASAPKSEAEGGGTPGAPILPDGAEINPDDYETVTTPARLAEWVAEATLQGFVAIDTETTGLDAMSVDLVGVSLATQPGKACYVPLAHKGSDGDGLALDGTTPDQMPMQEALALLKPLFEDRGVLKIGQNLKYDMLLLTRYDIRVTPIDDTMLMSYALEAGLTGHGMDPLSQLHLDHTPIPFKEIAGTGKKQLTFDQIPVDQATRYAAEDADITLRLWGHLKPRLAAERMTTVYETLERPLVPVLVQMEGNGIKVDAGTLSRLSGDFAQKMGALEADIYEIAGENFNIGSPKQLGEILFDKMGLEGGKKTKTGAWGTGADVLESLAAQGHDLPRRVLDWRGLSKLKSTYTDSLPDHINKDTGRVHTSYSLAATTTGRLASTDPNLQNIPIRTEDGRKIREAFVAEEGNVLLCADYSQIELRLLAHIANIDALKS
ncbi:MAG: DNA polymerase, partial [Alphaproteobacteria bacterium]